MMSNSSSKNYGSIGGEKKLLSNDDGDYENEDFSCKSVDATEWEAAKQRRQKQGRKREPRRVIIPYDARAGTGQRDDFAQTSADILLSSRTANGALCNSTYIVEPVAFIQNLATSIMGFSLGQFIYSRILTRLINQAQQRNNTTTTTTTTTTTLFTTTSTTSTTTTLITSTLNRALQNFTTTIFPPLPPPSNQTDSCDYINNTNRSLLSSVHNKASSLMLTYLEAQKRQQPSEQLVNSYLTNSMASYNATLDGLNSWGITPDEMNQIRNQAQSDTAHLYFISALFSGIPVIIMTNVLGVNCSTLGRKTLLLIYLAAMSIKFTLLLFQCIYPEWPDWLFYVGAFTEGISGSSGVFYLSLYCYISDYSSASSRSYRITFLNSLNSIASLCVTFICGYMIQWYGYFYLFLVALVLMVLSLIYTVLLIPEPLVELKDKSMVDRLKLCSLRRTLNCFTVYFEREREKSRNERATTSRQDQNEIESSASENDRLLANKSPAVATTTQEPTIRKQTFVLLLIVFANFLFVFGTVGIGSIFTLFIMNAPFCFDPIDISNFSVFSTIISLLVSLFISKFVRVNDLLICILSTASYFGAVFCYIFGSSTRDVYLASVIGSPAGLEYGYVRSIVSKSVERDEVADALSLILIVDTIIGVTASIVFQILYSQIVSKGITILFSFSNGFVLIALICHIINYCLYVPVKETVAKPSREEETTYRRIQKMPRYISLSEDNLARFDDEDTTLIKTAEHLNVNQNIGESVPNPMQQSLIFSNAEFI